MNSVVVLNADYSFLNMVSWKKAFKLLAKEKVEVVKWADECIFNAVGKALKIPAVMKLIKFIRTIYKTRVPFAKKNVYIRDNFECAYCGLESKKLTIDHILPKSRGGKSTFENCVASCKPCNNKKGNRLCSEIKMYPKKNAYQPTISQFLQLKMKTLGIDRVINDLFKGI